jgi:hypothetical protein
MNSRAPRQPPVPAPSGRRCRFGADQDVGQLTVGRAPGAHHLRRGDLVAQHFGNGAQQAGADDRVVLRQDLQGHVLVDDLRHQVAQLVELVDVAGVHQHAIGQGARLVTAGLVRLVEQRAHLGYSESIMR